MSSLDYEIRIRRLSEEDGGGYLATVPELPGCMSDGETRQEALENVFDAINCWMEAARKMGREPPQPRWVDPDEGPEWTDEMFDMAQISVGGKVIRPATGVLTKDGMRPLAERRHTDRGKRGNWDSYK